MKKIFLVLVLNLILISGVSAYNPNGGSNTNEYLNFNGEIIGPHNEISNVNDFGNNGYQYKYNDGPYKYHLNINGKDYGPYSYVDLAKEFNDGFVYYYRVYNDDGINQSTYLNVNGKIYGPVEGSNIQKLGDFGYYTKYTKGFDKYYLNYNGKEYGPYEEEVVVDYIGGEEYKNRKFSFIYKENNQRFISVDNEIYGPYDDISEVDEGNFKYIKNNKAYIHFLGKDYGPYDKGNVFEGFGPTFIKYHLDDNSLGKTSGFSYKQDDKYHININGKDYGPFDSIYYDTEKFRGKGFAFRYYNDSKNYININDKIYGPFDHIWNLGLLLEDFYSFKFYKKSENANDTYLNINGKEYGPYKESSLSDIKRLGKGYYFVEYTDEGYVVNTNYKNYGPYKNINEFYVYKGYVIGNTKDNNIEILNENGVYNTINNVEEFNVRLLDKGILAYEYTKGDEKYININGEDILYNNDYHFNPYKLDDGYMYSFSRESNSFVNVNGKEYGPYDKDKYTNVETVKNFYGFGYKINGERYVNINGKDYGPYIGDKYIGVSKIGDNGIGYIISENYPNGYPKSSYKHYVRNIDTIKKEIKPNPKLDKVLNNFFSKIDKKGEDKAKIVYQTLIKKVDELSAKTSNNKTNELLEYIKIKVEEKIN